MNLYHLRYFVILAHMEHYTKAAEVLSITQPSLSHAIAALESELGVKLFEKSGRNIILTKCGTVFLEDVEKSLEMLESSIHNLQMIGRGEGLIDIALLRTLSTNLVPRLVRGFLDERPLRKIDFNFHNSSGLSSDIVAGIKSKKYDVGFCSKVPDEPTVEFLPIARQKLVVIVPPTHPLANLKCVNLIDTVPYPQIMFSKKSGLRPIIDDLFLKCGGKPIISYEVSEDHTVAGLVANYFGIAVVPDMQILNSMKIKKLDIVDYAWERNFYMATLKDCYHAPIIEEFKNYIITHGKTNKLKSKLY